MTLAGVEQANNAKVNKVIENSKHCFVLIYATHFAKTIIITRQLYNIFITKLYLFSCN